MARNRGSVMTREEAEARFPHMKHFPYTGKPLEAFDQAKDYARTLGLSRPAENTDPNGCAIGEVDDPDGTILPGKLRYVFDVTLRWRDRAIPKAAP